MNHRASVNFWGCVTATVTFIASTAMASDRSWTLRVTDAEGRPISGATVTLVPIPPGGLHQLNSAMHEGRSAQGREFTTNAEGSARLIGLPHGSWEVSGYTEPYVSTQAGRPVNEEHNRVTYEDLGPGVYGEDRMAGIHPHAEVVQEHTLFKFVHAPWTAVLVHTPAFRGYAGQVQLNRFHGSMEIVLRDGSRPELRVSAERKGPGGEDGD